jgi:hypothetical protein
MSNEFAFPQTQAEWRDSDGRLVHEVTGGMTLLDYFAAEALQGFLSVGACVDRNRVTIPERTQDIAEASYKLAGAMMKARKEAKHE